MRQRSLLLSGLAGVLLLGAVSSACSDDDDSAGAGSGDVGDDSTSDALDADEVRDQITRLLVEYDDVVNQIIADPQVTQDSDGPLVERYLDLFEPDSEFAGQALETWRTNADDGISIKPYDDEHPANLTRLDGDVQIVSDDEVRFPTCSEFRQLVYEGERVVEGLPFMEQPGESVAVLTDDVWVFRRRDVFTDVPECQTESDTDTENQTENPTGSQTEGPTEGN
jgi:hypothetical protein